MKIKFLVISSLSVIFIFSLLAAFTSIPLGIPSEWTWCRVDKLDYFPLFELIAIGFFFAVSVFLVYNIDRKPVELSRKLLYILIIIVFASFYDYYIILSGRSGISEQIFSVIDPYTSGYLMLAGKINEPCDFFQKYDQFLEKDACSSNHLDVHPPGNVAFSYLVLESCRNSPLPAWVINQVLPSGVMKDVNYAAQAGVFKDVSFDEKLNQAAAFIVILFLLMNFISRILLVSALLVFSRGVTRNIGLNTLLLGFGIPGLILFLGHYDVMMFFIGASCSLLLALAVAKEYWKFPIFSMLTGIMLAIGVIHSLAFAALIFAFILTIFCCRRQDRKYYKILMLIIGGGIVVAICQVFDMNIINMCLLSSRNNSRFFAESGRSYFWLPFNLLDFFIFAGPLLVTLAFVFLPKLKEYKRFNWPSVQAVCFAAIFIMLLLLISPFSKGEMGRLMLFFMPFYALGAGLSLAHLKLNSRNYAMLVCTVGATGMMTIVLRLFLKLVLVN